MIHAPSWFYVFAGGVLVASGAMQLVMRPRGERLRSLVSLGGLFLAHAGLKLFVFTPAGTAQFFGSVGLPPALAYLTIATEVLGGIALILGVWTRVVAIVLVPILLGAIFTVHGSAGFFSTTRMAVGNIRRSGSSR